MKAVRLEGGVLRYLFHCARCDFSWSCTSEAFLAVASKWMASTPRFCCPSCLAVLAGDYS